MKNDVYRAQIKKLSFNAHGISFFLYLQHQPRQLVLIAVSIISLYLYSVFKVQPYILSLTTFSTILVVVFFSFGRPF